LFNRGNHCFNFTADELRNELISLQNTPTITDKEEAYLRTCSGLDQRYITWLKGQEKPLNKCEIEVTGEGENLQVLIYGHWLDTILLEVPVMALISELHNTPFRYDDGSSLKKILPMLGSLVNHNRKFMEFGTRRRYSRKNHKEVFNFLECGCLGSLLGTSNVLLSYLNLHKPLGTIAHEWFLANFAKCSIPQVTERSISSWQCGKQEDNTAYLTDTFTSDVFFKSLGNNIVNFKTFRQDSGDPIKFVDKLYNHLIDAWYSLNMTQKDWNIQDYTIVFSDSLNLEKIERIVNYMESRRSVFPVKYIFGIGTSLTNNIEGVQPLNIVIKPIEFDYVNVAKVSDDPGKVTGDAYLIQFDIEHFLKKGN
jgi:nicotinate phosphoribosyltransferase